MGDTFGGSSLLEMIRTRGVGGHERPGMVDTVVVGGIDVVVGRGRIVVRCMLGSDHSQRIGVCDYLNRLLSRSEAVALHSCLQYCGPPRRDSPARTHWKSFLPQAKS